MNRTAIGCMAALTLIAGAHAQTFTVGVPLVDLSKSTQVIPFPFGGTLPTTGCVPNSFYNKTGGSAGLYLNSGTGTCSWALVTGGGGGGVTCAVAGGITCVGTQVAADPAIVTFNSATAGGLSSGTSSIHCASSSASGTTYTATCGIALTAYSTNQTLWWNCDTTSTGASTINIDTLGAKPLKQANGTAIAAGTLTCPAQFPITYNGTNFYVLTAGLGGGSSGPWTPLSKGMGSSVTMDGTDKELWPAVTIPVNLAVGACLDIKFLGLIDAGSLGKIYVDSTVIASPFAVLGAQAEVQGMFSYCNDAGVQNTQTFTTYRVGYSASWNTPPNTGLIDYANQGNLVAATNNIDWSVGSHTMKITFTNGGGGTAVGWGYRIAQ